MPALSWRNLSCSAFIDNHRCEAASEPSGFDAAFYGYERQQNEASEGGLLETKVKVGIKQNKCYTVCMKSSYVGIV